MRKSKKLSQVGRASKKCSHHARWPLTEKGEKGEESIGGIKKWLRNSMWIGERISLNWIKVYGFRQSSLLSLLRLSRMLILFLYWHWHFKLFSIDISWQVITQSCKLLGIFGGKKNPLCFYTNVPSLNKLEEYVNFTDCLKIWPKDYQDTNQKKLEKWISTRACDVMCIGKILISKLDRQVSKHPIRILKNSNTVLKTNPSGWKLSRDFTCAARFDIQSIHLKKHCPFLIVLPLLVYN